MQDLAEKEKSPAATGDSKNIKAELYSISNFSIAQREQFLNAIFENSTGYIEIREISNESEAKQKFFKSINELAEYRPPEDKNVFFGVYDKSKKNGRTAACKSTGALWLDFDNMELIEVDYRIEMSGLPKPSIKVLSGGGIHCYWLLEERTEKGVTGLLKAMSEITGADSGATDKARTMRYPYSWNIKEKYPDPIQCKILDINNKRYKLDYFIKLLGVTTDKKPELLADKLNIDYEDIISKVEWPCIKSILEGVEEGQRNWSLGRLTKYFKNIAGYSKSKTQKIILVWNSLNNPAKNEKAVLTSFNAFWHNEYNLLGCKIPKDKGKQQILNAHCNKSECSLSNSIKFKEKGNKKVVEYNNRLIKNIKKISGNALIIYGVLERNPEGLTADKASKIIGVTPKTFRKRAKELITLGYAKIKKGNRRTGTADLYYLNKQGTYNTGRTPISYGAVRLAAIGDITHAQFKVYTLLNWYWWFSKTGRVYPSTITLGEKLGIDQSSVCRHIKVLEEKDYIDIDRQSMNSNEYELKI